MTFKKKILLFFLLLLTAIIIKSVMHESYKEGVCKILRKKHRSGDSTLIMSETTDFLWDSMYVIHGWSDRVSIKEKYGITINNKTGVFLDNRMVYVFFYQGHEVLFENPEFFDDCVINYPKEGPILPNEHYKIILNRDRHNGFNLIEE